MKITGRLLLTVSVSSLAGMSVAPLYAHPEQQQQTARGKDFYEKQILPVLEEFCYDCHADGVDKGELLLDKYSEYSAIIGDRKMWDHVSESLSTHVMPPENKDQPTLEQRKLVLDWIENEVFWVDPTKPDPGHVTLRRLNRTEYNNTIRDVFRVDARPARNFPPDDTGYGYDNIGDVLSLSPLLMEKYMRAARNVAEEAVWVKPPSRDEDERRGGEFKVTAGSGGEVQGFINLYGNGDAVTQTKIKEEGWHRVGLLLSANQAGNENARYAVLIDGQEVKTGEVTKSFDPKEPYSHWQRVAFDVWMKPGDRKVTVRFLNDYYDAKAEPNKRDRNLMIQALNVNGPIKFRPIAQSKFLEWLMQGKKIVAPQMILQGFDFDATSDSPGVISTESSIAFVANGTAERTFEVPAGEFRIRLIASADQTGNENARMNVKLGNEQLGKIEITNASGKEQWFSFPKKLAGGKHTLSVTFENDFYDEKTKGDRNAYLDRVIIEGPINQAVPVFGQEASRAWITRLGLKAFRRPMEKEDVDKLVALVEMAQKEGASSTEAISVVCEAILNSSKFLFIGGADPVGPITNGAVLVDEYALATRLAYFLWSSAPDDELLRLASEGKLRENFDKQVRRMIADWRGWAMSENFAGQWLRLRDMDLVSPNAKMYPEFKGGIRNDMKKESQLYFDHILRGNRNVMEFLDSDYTFLNESLAKYYGIEGVKGHKFQQVSLKGTPRGGILTHGSILTLTSHPNRTSPVKRGQFLLENIMGTPPPPAPQNIPPFGEDRGAKAAAATLRQRFEAHRANPACASCHAFMDPFGFAFENYDAIGRWRDLDNTQAIDASGKLLTGQTFNNAQQLRKLLVDVKKEDFINNLVENLLIYSLGRGLGYSDKLFVKQLSKRAAENDYRLQDLIIAVTESVPFQKMRDPSAKDTASN